MNLDNFDMKIHFNVTVKIKFRHYTDFMNLQQLFFRGGGALSE